MKCDDFYCFWVFIGACKISSDSRKVAVSSKLSVEKLSFYKHLVFRPRYVQTIAQFSTYTLFSFFNVEYTVLLDFWKPDILGKTSSPPKTLNKLSFFSEMHLLFLPVLCACTIVMFYTKYRNMLVKSCLFKAAWHRSKFLWTAEVFVKIAFWPHYEDSVKLNTVKHQVINYY